MADVFPFNGLYYDPARVPIDKVIAPPYDVLSPAQQDALYALDPHNIVRIMLNRETATDTPADNRYTRAAGFLNEWLKSGILVQDSEPAFYEYVQKFAHPLDPTQRVERSALFVALKLEPYENGVVLPHEETHPKAKADRLDLMRATHSNPEPIYGLYEDPELDIPRLLALSRGSSAPIVSASVAGPLGDATDEHQLYRHTGASAADIQAFMSGRRIWIADGHHRYETALNYQRERRAAEGDPAGMQGYDTMLVGLTSFEEPGLIVLPTHRLVRNISAERMDSLKALLERYFEIVPMTADAAAAWIQVEKPSERRFAIVHSGGALGLVLRDLTKAAAAAAEGYCEAWKRLDVTILQTLVLDRTFGIMWKALAHTPDVAYTRDAGEALAKVASGEFQVACLLQNPTVTEVRDVASAGDKMPQKSTFFYPKLWSGLLLRSLG